MQAKDLNTVFKAVDTVFVKLGLIQALNQISKEPKSGSEGLNSVTDKP